MTKNVRFVNDDLNNSVLVQVEMQDLVDGEWRSVETFTVDTMHISQYGKYLTSTRRYIVSEIPNA